MSRLLTVLLSALALAVWLLGANQPLFIVLHHALAVVPGAVWRLCSMFGEWTVATAVLLLLAARKPALLPRMLVLGLAGVAASIWLKAGFAVPRPPLVLPPGTVTLLDNLPGNASFPSGHAIAVGVLTGALLPRASLRGQLGLAAGALLVCLSRIAIGVHWPLDVLAGLVLGLVLAAAAQQVPKSGLPSTLLLPLVKLLALVLLGVSVWHLQRMQPNAAYVLFNLMTLAAALLVLRQK